MRQRSYTEEQYKQRVNSSLFGAFLAICINLLLLLFCNFHGVKYNYPPPLEKYVPIEVETMRAPIIRKPVRGQVASIDNVDRTKIVQESQKSESPVVHEKKNVGKANVVDEVGDVEMTNPQEEAIEQRALFPSAQNGNKEADLTAAREITDRINAGRVDGNSTKGDNEPNANVQAPGRAIEHLVKPIYNTNTSGTVVVRVTIDADGKIIKASIDGGSVGDGALQQRALEAAKKSTFKPSPTGQVTQGHITYIFTLQ